MVTPQENKKTKSVEPVEYGPEEEPLCQPALPIVKSQVGCTAYAGMATDAGPKTS